VFGSLSREVIRRTMRGARRAMAACLAHEHARRPHEQLRVTASIALVEREVEAVTIDGDVSDTTRVYLIDAFDDLEVPFVPFGTVVGHPMRIEAEPITPAAPLRTDVAAAVDAIAP
jgi:hypothetical protein